MKRSIIIFGAGPGLGSAVARKFGGEGYAIAVVGRRLEPLKAQVAELAMRGVTAAAFSADLSRPGAAAEVVAAVRDAFGDVNAIYYGPATAESSIPARELTSQMMRDRTELLFIGLVDAVAAALPLMRARGSGAVLAGLGFTALAGVADESGPAPAHAAARNYLQSLHAELAPEGIRIGMVTVAAAITGSAYNQSMDADEYDSTDDDATVVEADLLADILWQVAEGVGALETFYPPSTN